MNKAGSRSRVKIVDCIDDKRIMNIGFSHEYKVLLFLTSTWEY